MRIGIDALGIEKASGGRTSVFNLLKALFAIDQDNQYLVAVSSYEPHFISPAGNVKQMLLPIRNRFLRRIAAQATLPFWMRNCDVIHFTKNLSLLGGLPPYILTIHDLSMLKYPQLMPKTDLFYWRTIQRYSAIKAARVITVSQSAARDIEKYYGVDKSKIRVVYHGVSSDFKPAEPEEIERVRKKYKLPTDFIIHVGRIDPIKNLTSLVYAFDMLRKRIHYQGGLVIVGEFYRKTPDLNLIPTIEKLNLKNEVILTGYIPDEDLPAVYSAAHLKVFPSHNEGFGLAPLEAMACGVPVIVNKAGGAVAEVVGDAGIVLEKNDPETVYEAIVKIFSDETLERKLRKAALERAKIFRWEQTAKQTLEIYRELAVNR